MYNVGIGVTIYSAVTVNGNRISGGRCNLQVNSDSFVGGSGNILYGGTFATILIYGSNIGLNGSHILNNGGSSVFLNYFNPPDIHLDMIGNYWGTADSTQISEWIIDGYDDPSTHAFVDFAPFSGQPQPADRKSWGELKNLYR